MPIVDPASNATVADVGVNSIGKVNGIGTTWQRNKIAIGGETEHLIVKQFQLGVFEEFFWAVRPLQANRAGAATSDRHWSQWLEQVRLFFESCGEPASLYSPWAAIPRSATSCIALVLIWSSTRMRCGPMTVV